MNNHRHFAECTSTSDVARDWATDTVDAAPEGALVTADFQTAGRGRRGRVWQSAVAENALMSVVLRPPYDASEAWKLAFVAGLAVADAVKELGALPALKWPNDVLVDGSKVAGVLVEIVVTPGGQWAAIVGMGVNVNQGRFADAGAFEVHPTSLLMALGRSVDVDVVRQLCHLHLLAREDQHRRDGFNAIVADWRAGMATGYEIKRGPERGIQTGLLESGEIEVELPDGTLARWGTVDA